MKAMIAKTANSTTPEEITTLAVFDVSGTGASCDLLMVMVVLASAMLLEFSSVMFTQ